MPEGQVYSSSHLEINVPVAIKILPQYNHMQSTKTAMPELYNIPDFTAKTRYEGWVWYDLSGTHVKIMEKKRKKQ